MRRTTLLRLAIAAVLATAGTAVSPSLSPAPAAATRPALTHDFNGDGYRDVAIGEPAGPAVDAAQTTGQVRVIYGSSTGLNIKRYQLLSQSSPGVPDTAEPGDRFGSALASADFDADGYADLAVTSLNETGTGILGSVTVIFGSTAGLSSRAAAFGLPTDGDPWLVARLAVADFDQDAHPDLLMGSRDGAYLWYGAANMAGTRPQTLPSPANGADFGVENVAAGDISGDGRPDAVVVWYPTDLYEFRMSVYPGSASGLQPPLPQPFTGSGRTGEVQMAMGDIDGDGHADLVHRQDDWDDRDGGAILIRYGAATGIDPARQVRVTQNTPDIPGTGVPGDTFGSSLDVRDINGDQRADIAVGAVGKDVGTKADAGAVWVLYGRSGGLTGTGSQMFTQDTAGVPDQSQSQDRFGDSVAILDVKPDARPDLLVTAPFDTLPWESSTCSCFSSSVTVLRGTTTGITTTSPQAIPLQALGGTDTTGNLPLAR